MHDSARLKFVYTSHLRLAPSHSGEVLTDFGLRFRFRLPLCTTGSRFAKSATKQLLPDQLSAAAAKLDECGMLHF